MKKIVLLLIVTLVSINVYAQIPTIKNLINIHAYTNTQISDFLITKKILYKGKDNLTYDNFIVDNYRWSKANSNKQINEVWIKKSVYYKKDETGEKGDFMLKSISLETYSSNDYLLLKKELATLGFKFLKDDEFDGALVSSYMNNIHFIQVFTDPINGSWLFTVYLKKDYDILLNN